jgi:ubiquinone/menaquinone biosynthesis C-methylase UbiE
VTDWLERNAPPPDRNRALVVACGLGDDAEALAAHGWSVTAFDSSATAIDWARERFPETSVDYRLANLFDLPAAWHEAFDLVVEVHTIQALPVTLRQEVIGRITGTVARGGTLLVVTFVRDAHMPARGRPWPLTRREIDTIARGGLVATDRTTPTGHPGRMRITFERRSTS